MIIIICPRIMIYMNISQDHDKRNPISTNGVAHFTDALRKQFI